MTGDAMTGDAMTGDAMTGDLAGVWSTAVLDAAFVIGPLADSPIFKSVVLTNPVVVGGLAAAAVCWGGFITRPEPARRRSMLLAATARHTGGAFITVDSLASHPARWLGLARSRRSDVPHPDRVAAELGAIVDVMNVALASGLSIMASLQLALAHRDAASPTGRWLAALTAPHRPLDEALDEFGRACGPRARAFAAAVTGSMRTGIPLAPELERLGRELRSDVRRRLERRVRRLPVLLLFPLVLCVLPALGLIAIVPVLVAAFGA
ncbi:type II secretion system F family protein [Candidatus Poriferisodalis sp.]|uniref:type II secretion system F family protein n=1 Tax=Candidatus Poriferisodalis sp. TaxID=3101277 RepID=UPI003B593C34